MPTACTTTFFDPGEYQAGFRGAAINLVFSDPGIFTAHLTSVSLPNLKLLSVRENLPRIAYVSLAPESINFAFSTLSNSPVMWGASEMMPLDLMFHSVGERIHQRTSGASGFGIISVDPKFFTISSRALVGSRIIPPRVGRVLRPRQADAVELRRLHANACRLAETNAHIITRREVARAIENDIIYTLVNCLTADVQHDDTAKRCHRAIIMNQFEDVLAAKQDRKVLIPELCGAIGVTERTLRNCCLEVLGMSPNRYLRLRRLNLLHVALRRADPLTAEVSEIAERYGFSKSGRLAVSYRTIFGETPSATLRCTQITRPGDRFSEIA
jgi:AraC-like DNA-binding protein